MLKIKRAKSNGDCLYQLRQHFKQGQAAMQCAFLKTELLFLIREGAMMQRETLDLFIYILCVSLGPLPS